MYPLHLSATERRLFTRALRGGNENTGTDPDVPGDRDDESTDGPKTGDTTTTPGSDPGGNPMRLVTANVLSTMTNAKTGEDFDKIRGLGSIILLQEIGPASADVLRHHFPDSAWHVVPGHRDDKLVIKKSLWDVDQSGTYFMVGKSKVRGKVRYVNVALVRLKGTSIQFLVVDTHYVPHAWCNHPRADKQQRKNQWARHHDRFGQLVLDARAKGITVIGGGDFNRSDPAKFHTSQVWFRQAALDHLFGLPATGGASFTLGATQSVALNSDHNALVAQLSWTAGANALKSGYNWGGA